MPLVLTIVRQPEGSPLAETRKLFHEDGGTLGRAADNNWSLPDPSRFVSSHHASIRYDRGDFYLVDTSTNGVFVNNNDSPLGTGNQVRLQQGDKLYLGEYEIHVEFQQSESAASMSSDDFDQWLGPETTDTSADLNEANDLLTPEQELLDPLAALDKASSPPAQAQWSGASIADNAAVPEQAFIPPDPIPEAQAFQPTAPAGDSGMIPDDWDIDDLLSGDAPPPSPAQVPSPAAPPQAPATDPSAIIPDNLSDDLDALLDDPGEGILSEAPSKAESESNELDAFLGLDDDSDVFGSSNELDDLLGDAPAVESAVPTPPVPEPPVVETPAAPGEPVVEVPVPDSPEPELEEPPVPPSPSVPPVPDSLIASEPAPSAPQQPAVSSVSCDELIRSLGLDPERMSKHTRDHFQELLADTLRETVTGMMQVLGARNAIKNEFRMNVTMIQPMENNPLKFSPNAEEAMRNMFTSQSNAYLPGTLAIREGFQDVADHQVTVIAGMRAAFRSLLKRFEPAELQVRFDKQHQAGFLASKKGKYWEAYGEFYSDLADNMDDAFQDLFGEDFAEAYEQQMARLEAVRKK